MVSINFEVEISFYRNTADKDSKSIVKVSSVLEAIRSGKYKALIDKIRACKSKEQKTALKFLLPCATFSGIFKKRFDNMIETPSGFASVDIDDLGGKSVNTVKGILSDIGFVYAAFESLVVIG